MKVKELIELLQIQNQEADAVLEGCDCEDYCSGVSLSPKHPPDGNPAVLLRRRSGGCFDRSDGLEIITLAKQPKVER
jgi:hypothetical protein